MEQVEEDIKAIEEDVKKIDCHPIFKLYMIVLNVLEIL